VTLDAPCHSVAMTPVHLLLGTHDTISIHSLRQLLGRDGAEPSPVPTLVRLAAAETSLGDAEGACCVSSMLPFLPASVVVLDSRGRLHVLHLPDSPACALQPHAVLLVRARLFGCCCLVSSVRPSTSA
jgi:hypothetical protein